MVDERLKALFSAMRAGDWEVAHELVQTPEEMRMLERRQNSGHALPASPVGASPPSTPHSSPPHKLSRHEAESSPLLADAESRLAAAECRAGAALEEARVSDAALEAARVRASGGAALLLTAKVEAAVPVAAAPAPAPLSRCLACWDTKHSGGVPESAPAPATDTPVEQSPEEADDEHAQLLHLVYTSVTRMQAAFRLPLFK